MKFSESEIEKAKELKRLKLHERIKNFSIQPGYYLSARECPKGCIEVAPHIFLVVSTVDPDASFLWLPTFDNLIEATRDLKISFSQITDYLHRRRFADVNEREGVYQLLIEKLR